MNDHDVTVTADLRLRIRELEMQVSELEQSRATMRDKFLALIDSEVADWARKRDASHEVGALVILKYKVLAKTVAMEPPVPKIK